MNFRIPSTPEQWIQLAGPVVAAIAAILALVGIGVGVGSSEGGGSSSKSPSTVTTTATAVATETVAATTVTAAAPSVSESTANESSVTPPSLPPSENPTPTSKPAVLNKFEENVLEISKGRYEIVKVEVLPAKAQGNLSNKPIIVFTYEFTNKSPENSRALWGFTFKAVQDNDPDIVNELRSAVYLNGEGDSLTEVKPGGKIRLVSAYELTDVETPVTLKASNLVGTEYGEQTFSIK